MALGGRSYLAGWNARKRYTYFSLPRMMGIWRLAEGGGSGYEGAHYDDEAESLNPEGAVEVPFE